MGRITYIIVLLAGWITGLFGTMREDVATPSIAVCDPEGYCRWDSYQQQSPCNRSTRDDQDKDRSQKDQCILHSRRTPQSR